MSLSTCLHCGGHIPIGPDASNICEVCGKGVFSSPNNESIITELRAKLQAAEAENETLRNIAACSASHIDRLQAEVARLTTVNKKHFGELERDDEFITHQKNRIAELEQEVARLKDNNQTNYLGETK